MNETIAAQLRAPAPAAAEAARRLGLRAATEGVADVSYATLDSPLGPLLAASTTRGLVRLAYVSDGPNEVLEDLVRRISPRIVEVPSLLASVARELDEYFAGHRRRFDAPLDWRLVGSFGRRVLQATAGVAYGQVSSYGAVAEQAGSPRATRAAGNALGANPLPIIVPCHRILRTDGTLGGYTGGLARKRHLLALEGYDQGSP